MKKLFKNYNFEFNKNEKKLLTNFCKQALKQMKGDDRFFREVGAYESIIAKLNEPGEIVKFTKDERTKLELQLKNNYSFLKDKIKKSMFITRWLYGSLLKQYEQILETHFND